MVGAIHAAPAVPGLIMGHGLARGASKIKRAIHIAGYTGLAAAFLYGAVKVRGLVRNRKKAKEEKQQREQVAEMYAEFKKQKSR